MNKTITLMILYFLATFPGAAIAETIVKASTEEVTPGEITPSTSLVDTILATADENDSATFSKCVRDAEKGANDPQTFFRAVRVPVAREIGALYFVRPALKPYCQTFYGAHLFQYWIVRETATRNQKSYDVRYAGVADFLEILSSQHNSYPDIVETNCRAMGCGSATLHYDGEMYFAVNCKETTFNKDGSETTRGVPCPEAYAKRRRTKRNRVAGGVSPPAPTPPGMRVRTRRFAEITGPWPGGES